MHVFAQRVHVMGQKEGQVISKKCNYRHNNARPEKCKLSAKKGRVIGQKMQVIDIKKMQGIDQKI